MGQNGNECTRINYFDVVILCVVFWNRFLIEYALKNVMDYGDYVSGYCDFDCR